MSVLSVADVKPYLNEATLVNDGELRDMIEAAEAAVAKRVGSLTQATVTDRVRGDVEKLTLPQLPVISLTSVTPVNSTAVTLSNLNCNSAGVVEWVYGGFFPAPFYDVVYVTGRATLPEDLKHAVLAVVKHLWVTQRPAGRRGADPDAVAGAAHAFTWRSTELFEQHEPPGFG